MKVNARGLEFDVRVGGPDDGRPVLLLHGFPQHGGMWDAVSTRLHAAGLRTIAPDQRGYSPGARPSDVDTYTMPEFALDAVAILDALGIEQADVVGHDWGSAVGWQLCGNHAERVRSYTAVAVPHPGAMTAARRIDDQKQRSSYFNLFAIEGKAEDVLLADDAQRLRALFSPLAPEIADVYVKPMLDRAALTGALNWYRRLSREPLAASTIPVTYVWGTEDPAVSPAAAHACFEYVAPGVDFRFVPLPGISHWAPDQAPGKVAVEVLGRIGTM
jgi:pimeloyl-ACP methyl ester carboxylesterase